MIVRSFRFYIGSAAFIDWTVQGMLFPGYQSTRFKCSVPNNKLQARYVSKVFPVIAQQTHSILNGLTSHPDILYAMLWRAAACQSQGPAQPAEDFGRMLVDS
jgi:hypothetical protein